MSTYIQIYYHIVFSTKNRIPCLLNAQHENLFRYIWGILKNNDCHLYRINAVLDHIHLFTRLHPGKSLSDLVKTIKSSSTIWIKKHTVFKEFSHWQEGYGAFTHSNKEKGRIIKYIKNQENHHKTISFKDELQALLDEAGIKYDERYLI